MQGGRRAGQMRSHSEGLRKNLPAGLRLQRKNLSQRLRAPARPRAARPHRSLREEEKILKTGGDCRTGKRPEPPAVTRSSCPIARYETAVADRNAAWPRRTHRGAD